MTITKVRPLDFGGDFERAGRMSDRDAAFAEIVAAILVRYATQNGLALTTAEGTRVGEALLRAVRRRGLPRPLVENEAGTPGGMPESDCRSIAADVLVIPHAASFDAPVQQLVKACFHPAFRQCRQSYREVGSDGVCRRQDLTRARARTSGTHCVDCPYWTVLEADAHARFLRNRWRADPREFMAHQTIFLPEDFRALRRWLRDEALQTRREASSDS